MNKWQQWYNSLPDHTKEYLSKQAIWTDADLAKFCVLSLLLGVLLGLAL